MNITTWIESNKQKLLSQGLFLTRISLALVFLYFGISQLTSPEQFVGWLPAEATLFPFSDTTLIILNGGLELFAGILLLLGLFSRLAALILGLHLLAITISIGYTEIGVRDFGLAIATIALSLTGPGAFAIDK